MSATPAIAAPEAITRYTLIAHNKGYTAYDSKTGDHEIEGDLFVCETFTDRGQFLTAWATLSLKSTDSLTVLINGGDQDSLGQVQRDALDSDFVDAYQAAKIADNARRQAEREEQARVAEREAARRQEVQRQRDLEQFRSLQTKLGL